uniref:Ig-like domain-containing protein n=1 Tax=Sinocyclocheilus anshuiensis TaxID=1608454 RepID=A0A671LPD4_9TELE
LAVFGQSQCTGSAGQSDFSGVMRNVERALCVLMYAGAASDKWEIKMPKKIDAISGFCVQIPCQFEIPDSFKQSLNKIVEAIWRKTSIDGPNVSLLKGNVIGNILDKNCTTVFHNFPDGFSDTFFFRLQGPEPLLYTFQQGVDITVHKGWNTYFQNIQKNVMEVLEGTSLTLTCSTVISCPSIQPQMQWNPQLGEQLTPALQVKCSMRQILMFVNYTVLYPEINTIALVSPSDPVSEGSVVVLSCHSDANPAVQRYEWYKDSGSGKLELQNQGQTLTLIARSTVQGLYVCEVYNNHGTERSRPIAVDINSKYLSVSRNFTKNCFKTTSKYIRQSISGHLVDVYTLSFRMFILRPFVTAMWKAMCFM